MEAWLLCVIIFGIFLFERNQLTTAECQEPEPVSHAYRDLQVNLVTYECMDGYQLVGDRYRKCDSDTWTGDPPGCIIDCGVPSEGFGAVVMYNDTLEGSVAEYACKANFTSRDSENAARTCLTSGHWSGSPLKCSGSEDLARGKEASDERMTDGDRQTCASYTASSSTLTVTLSGNIYYNVQEVELDLKVYTNQNSNDDVTVTVSVGRLSSYELCKRLGVYDSGVYKFTCATEGVVGSKMKIELRPGFGIHRTDVCEIKVYGSRYTGQCERTPVVVGARVNFTSTYWNSQAVYSCVPPYHYAGGNNVITCQFGGSWTTPSIKCKVIDNLAGTTATVPEVFDDDRSTCHNVDVDEIVLTLNSRSEVQWVVVSTRSVDNTGVSVKLMISNTENNKTCARSTPAEMDGYAMTAFTCQGYPFADMVIVTGGSSTQICEIEVYGQSASQGVLQCTQQGHGQDYKGDLNFTRTGQPCINWQRQGLYSIEAFPDYSFAEVGSKCRAPSTTISGPFCYISSSQFEYCHIPLCDSMCRQGDGRTYSGRIRNANGTSCGNWNSQAPNEFDFTGLTAVEAGSNCRNPLGSMSSPWCYSEVGEVSLCSIPSCPIGVPVVTSLPDGSSPQAKATCFCWYSFRGSVVTYVDRALSDILDRCSAWGVALMMCYTEDTSWAYYSIGAYVSSSSFYETSSTQEVPLISASEASLTSSNPAVSLISSTPAVSLISSTPVVSMFSSTPAVSLTSSTPAVYMASSTPSMSMTSSTPAVSMTSSIPVVSLTSSTPEVTLSSSTPAVSLTSSSPEVSLTSSTPAVPLTSSDPEVSLTSSTPAVSLTSSRPMVSLSSDTLAVSLTTDASFISSTPAVTFGSSSLEVTSTNSTHEFQSYRNATPVDTSLVQSSSVLTYNSPSKEAYNSSDTFSTSDLSSFVHSGSSSSYILSSSSSVADLELNISSTFEPSTQSFTSLSSVVAMSSSTTPATKVPTTTSTPTTTPAIKQNCQCRCKRNLSTAAISEVMDERKANLTVNPRETAAFLRTKTSAEDKRQTVTVSGTTCLAIVSVMGSCIFIPDIINVVSFFVKLFKK